VTGAWYGLWAPAGYPAAIEKISSDVRRIVGSPDIAAYMLNNGFKPRLRRARGIRGIHQEGSAKTAQVIKTANVRLE
jgi:tripartite-type tricarboxylate transporter receptor subunit TctC